MRTHRYSLLVILALIATCIQAIAGPDANPDPAVIPTSGNIETEPDPSLENNPSIGTNSDTNDDNHDKFVVVADPGRGFFTDFNEQGDTGNLAHQTVSKLLQLASLGENYIVELKPTIPVEEILSHIRWLETRIQVDLGLGHIIHKIHLPPVDQPADSVNAIDTAFYAYAGTLSPALVEVLRALSIVRQIDKDDIATLNLNNDDQIKLEGEAHIQLASKATAYVQQNCVWGLARICRKSPPNYNDPKQNSFMYSTTRGTGTDAFVLDTGVRISHSEFQGRASQPNVAGFYQAGGDPNGHGTHVGGIIGSRTYGVSKNSRIIALQVLGSNGTGPWSNVIKGIEYVVQSHRSTKRPSVINISITGAYNKALNNALIAATNNNVHVVVAAGNSNQDTCQVSPGSLGGSNSNVIVVGAVGKSDTMSKFSNWGKCVDVSAPGEWIKSLGNAADNATREMSGTSMASPHVAGAVSVILSRYPNKTPAQTKQFIKDNASASVKEPKGSTNKLLYLPPIL